jgi:hypothetical protein
MNTPPLRHHAPEPAIVCTSPPRDRQRAPRPSSSTSVDNGFGPYSSSEQGHFLFLRPPSIRLNSTTTTAATTASRPTLSRRRAHPPQGRWIRGSFLGARPQIQPVCDGRRRRRRRRRSRRETAAQAEARSERHAQGRGKVWGGDGEGR